MFSFTSGLKIHYLLYLKYFKANQGNKWEHKQSFTQVVTLTRKALSHYWLLAAFVCNVKTVAVVNIYLSFFFSKGFSDVHAKLFLRFSSLADLEAGDGDEHWAYFIEHNGEYLRQSSAYCC